MSASTAIPGPGRPPIDEDERLRAFGVTPVLSRRMGRFASMANPFSVISVVTGVIATLPLAMSTGGPAGMVWGWVLVSVCTLIVGVSMAELASAFPTSGALYHWTYELASERRRARLSHRVGWLNLLGLTGGVASVAFGGAVSLQALFALRWGYVPTKDRTLAITVGLLVLYGAVNTLSIARVALLSKISAWWHVGAVALIAGALIAFPARVQHPGYVLTHIVNETGFHSGAYALMLVLSCGAYVYCGYDVTAHLSEETKRASVTVPVALIRSIYVSAAAGLVLYVGLLAGIQNYDGELTSPTGSPATQIFLDALGTRWATVLLLAALIAQVFCGIFNVTATSRQAFAFSGRNQSLPGHALWAKVSERTRVPRNAVWLAVGLGVLLVLPSLWNNTALNAIVSINIVGLLPAYGIPIYLRLRHRDRFTPGPWNRGKHGPAYAALALVWITVICLIVILPQVGPLQPIVWSNVNYSGPVLIAVLLFEAVWWAASSRRRYLPPGPALSPADAAALQAEIV